MAQVEAIQDFWYDGRARKIGERFPATAKDAALLRGFGKISIVSMDDPVPVPPVRVPRPYHRRDMRPETRE